MKEKKQSEPKYLISMISSMLNIHPQTLRTYERLGLINPQRSKGNTRLYSEKDIERIRKILVLTRDMGVNLAGVEVIFRLQDQINEMQKGFQKLIEYIGEEFFSENPELSKKLDGLVKSSIGTIIKLNSD